MIKKQYLTWTRNHMKHDFLQDPYNAVHNLWVSGNKPLINYTEFGYGCTENDARMLAYIEYDDAIMDEELLERFRLNFCYHAFKFITEEKALELVIEWHGEYFELDTDGFTIIDNRPEDI